MENPRQQYNQKTRATRVKYAGPVCSGTVDM